jgi:ABC-type sugar transport system permease subunit
VLVTSTVTAFAAMFAYIFVITNGGPGFDTYVSEFLVYKQAFALGRLGYACAIGVVLTLITASLGVVQVRALTGRRS